MVNPQQTTLEQLNELIDPVCVDAGYELVEIEYKVGAPEGPILRVFIDFPEAVGKGITSEDCRNLSHELSAILDVEDPIAPKYNLEVSSPGIERPLRKPEHFRRFIGAEVKLALSHGVSGGRRKFKGLLTSVSESGEVVTLEVDGKSFDLPLADLASARIVPDWGALMKGKRA